MMRGCGSWFLCLLGGGVAAADKKNKIRRYLSTTPIPLRFGLFFFSFWLLQMLGVESADYDMRMDTDSLEALVLVTVVYSTPKKVRNSGHRTFGIH